MSLKILLIECEDCGRRVALDKIDIPAIRQGNQAYIRDPHFTGRKCGPEPPQGRLQHRGK